MQRWWVLLVAVLGLAAPGLSGCATGGDGVNPRGGDGGEARDAGESVCVPPCRDGDVCMGGHCAAPGGDRDGDGVPTATDCNDDDASVGSTDERGCSSACADGVERCVDGEWQTCTAPLACDCTDGSPPRSLDCGMCGQQQQVCTGGVWVDDGMCAGEGACSPGEVGMGSTCGMCGREERRCNSDCTWGAFTCVEGGECSPGEVGMGSTCGMCGRQERRCGSDCRWGGFSCVNEGTCAAGAVDTDSRACTPSCGGTESRTRTCGSTCEWGPYSGFSGCSSCGPVCGDGVCASGETCSSCADCRNGHLGSGDNGDPCPGVPAETWRCVTRSAGQPVSQVCRGGSWLSFHLFPRDCGACVCGFTTACCQAGATGSGCG